MIQEVLYNCRNGYFFKNYIEPHKTKLINFFFAASPLFFGKNNGLAANQYNTL